MTNQSNNALRLVPQSAPKQFYVKATKPVKKRDMSIVMKVRKTMREDAAMLRGLAKVILLTGLLGEAVIGYLSTIAKDLCEVALTGTPAAETFGWISLAVCIAAFIFGIVNSGLAFVLFTIASSITESAKDLITEV